MERRVVTDKETLLPHGDASPEVAPSAWVAPGALVIGAVHLGEDASVWYGAVLRGDTEPIRIGARTNIQDGCEIENGCLVGMGATILNGARIGEGSIVAAGALVPEGKEYPPRSLIVGIPAKRAKDVSEEQTGDIARGVKTYVERAASHRASLRRRS